MNEYNFYPINSMQVKKTSPSEFQKKKTTEKMTRFWSFIELLGSGPEGPMTNDSIQDNFSIFCFTSPLSRPQISPHTPQKNLP